MSTTGDEPIEDKKFKVLLNGTRDMQLQLQEFKKACDAYEKGKRKRCKRRYYQLGLMAKVIADTTDDELKLLLKNGTRTFLVDAVTNKPNELDQILIRLNNAIGEYQLEEPSIKIVTGLAIEIHGDCLRIGRMRNNCSVLLKNDDIITLTTDERYQYSCFKEIAYVINLKYYLKKLKLNDEIIIGNDIHCRIVKKLKDNVAVSVHESGLLNSYEYIELPSQCYVLQQENFPDLFKEDLEIATQANANYVVLPKIRCKPFLKSLRWNLKELPSLRIIGNIDLEFVSSKMLDLMGIIKLLDYLWIPDHFVAGRNMMNYIYEDVVPLARCLKIPIIGTVPLERCSDFKCFENHKFLWKIDTMFIEKSPWCNKYPLIVKKLLPIKDFRMGVTENCMTLKNVLTSYQSIVNFIIRTISSIECQAVIIHCKCEAAAVALGRVEIYCPVFVVLPLEDDEDVTCKMNLARSLNLRRNLRSVIYTKEMNTCGHKPIDFGVDYARKSGLLETGDFIITLEVCKETEDNVEYGLDGDVVLLRAYYMPPLKFSEKFKYG